MGGGVLHSTTLTSINIEVLILKCKKLFLPDLFGINSLFALIKTITYRRKILKSRGGVTSAITQ